MRTAAFVSEKGGVGKTTTAINVAACLARRGLRVLVVDADPQANASHVLLGGEHARPPTLLDVLTDRATATEATVPSVIAGVDVLPASAELADAANALAGEIGRERRLRVALARAGDRYDWTLIDTAPTRSLLTVNVLVAAGEVVVPITPGLFSVLGLGQLQSDVEQVRRFLGNESLRLAGIVLTMLDKHNVARSVEDQLREHFGGLVFRATVPRSIKLEEAHSRHLPVADYSPRSSGAAAYQALTEEILGNGGTTQADRGHDHPVGDPAADHAA